MQMDAGMSMTAPPPELPPLKAGKGGKKRTAKSKVASGSRGSAKSAASAGSTESPTPGADGVLDEKRIKFLERNRCVSTCGVCVCVCVWMA